MVNSKLASLPQEDHPDKNIFEDLHSPGLLARRPTIGWLMFIFGAMAFGALTLNLFAGGPLLVWDRSLANILPAIGLKSPVFVQWLMTAGFYLGKEVIMAVDILLAIYFINKKYWQEFSMVVIGWMGSALIFYTLSTLIGRVRPSTMIWIIVNIPGFPSGHAVASVTFYGLLAYLLAPRVSSAFWRWVVITSALIMIGFIGFSRIFTGGHYLTDILSGYAVGIAWSGAAYTLIELYFHKRGIQNDKKE